MAKKGRAHGEDAWRNAKKICRLNARQVEMARVLGLNPTKLPGLRPTPQQRWKLPVGAFIEECYRKRFARETHDHDSHVLEPSSRKHSPPHRNPHGPERFRNADWQLRDLVCYLIDLADDLQQWLAQGTVDREIAYSWLKQALQALSSVVT